MTLQPLTPLDLPVFASILREGGEIAMDWLVEQFAANGIDPAGPQATADVLLLYARDAHFTEALLARWLGMVGDGKAEEVNRWWSGRMSEVHPWDSETYSVLRRRKETHQAYGPWETMVRHSTESAARLDLKRRVLGLFGEVERQVVVRIPDEQHHSGPPSECLREGGFNLQKRWQGRKDKDNRQWLYWQTVCPIDFLPPQPQTLLGLPIVWTDEPQGIIEAPATPAARDDRPRYTPPERQRNRKKERRRG